MAKSTETHSIEGFPVGRMVGDTTGFQYSDISNQRDSLYKWQLLKPHGNIYLWFDSIRILKSHNISVWSVWIHKISAQPLESLIFSAISNTSNENDLSIFNDIQLTAEEFEPFLDFSTISLSHLDPAHTKDINIKLQFSSSWMEFICFLLSMEFELIVTENHSEIRPIFHSINMHSIEIWWIWKGIKFILWRAMLRTKPFRTFGTISMSWSMKWHAYFPFHCKSWLFHH